MSRERAGKGVKGRVGQLGQLGRRRVDGGRRDSIGRWRVHLVVAGGIGLAATGLVVAAGIGLAAAIAAVTVAGRWGGASAGSRSGKGWHRCTLRPSIRSPRTASSTR